MEANISIPQVINKWVSVEKNYQTLTPLPAGSNLKNLFHAKRLGGYSVFVNADQ